MSFMDHQVLGYQSPLYGRITAQFKIKSFTFFETVKYHKQFTKEEKAIIYGITGVIPEYLSKIKDRKPLKNNVIESFFSESGHLFEEPSSLLKQELREPAIYNSIITSIAKGASKLNEIATKIGIQSNKCAKYIASLLALGIVRREKPITEETSKRSIYVIEDNMFKFWYRFVPDNMTRIVAGNPITLYEQMVEPRISDYMGAIFEQICIQFLMKENALENLPIIFGNIGRWWGVNPILKQQEEIDIIALNINDGSIFGECKWTKDPVDIDVLENLIRKGALFQHSQKFYYLFSKNGFTNKCVQRAKENEKISLVSFNDMI